MSLNFFPGLRAGEHVKGSGQSTILVAPVSLNILVQHPAQGGVTEGDAPDRCRARHCVNTASR
jgi:hypothetical protein